MDLAKLMEMKKEGRISQEEYQEFIGLVLTDETKVGIELFHQLFCKSDHADSSCEWYEERAYPYEWTGRSHIEVAQAYLELAKRHNRDPELLADDFKQAIRLSKEFSRLGRTARRIFTCLVTDSPLY